MIREVSKNTLEWVHTNKMETKEVYLNKHFSQFDFVILAEFFDEGLVILARILCWELEDVKSKKLLILKKII